ncbi:MAG: hypothetical protein KDD25_01770 [Bdellovibrionales bacterium]|nr:hypothetical protein [Bdellovibrionales bacterium]
MFKRIEFLIFPLLLLALNLVISTRSTASSDDSEVSSVVTSLEISYQCDYAKFFKEMHRKAVQLDPRGLVPFGFEVPSNEEMNRRLKSWTQEALAEGLKRIKSVNPNVASHFVEILRNEKFLVRCTHLAAKHGGVAIAHERFIWFGSRVVNLGSASLVIANSEKAWQDDIDQAKRDIFHEFSHHMGGTIKHLLPHERDALDSGASDDLVYASGNFAFPLKGQKLGHVGYLEALEVVSNASPLRGLYGDLMVKEDKKELKIKGPFRPFIHAFHRAQCMTLLLARYSVEGQVFEKSNDPHDLESAEIYCDQNSVSIADTE